ncbi:MAG: flavin-containing monooxygenase [Gaiellaceae bacterium]
MSLLDVVVIGAGQAGLAVSYALSEAGVEHVVLERGLVGQSWRTRWESFCLVTPNATIDLPGAKYQGDDPDGFLRKEELVRYFVAWANSFDAPVREGVTVFSLKRDESDGFRLQTSDGVFDARSVVVCTGAYQRPHRSADVTAPGVLVIDAGDYRRESALPPGKVLVVGSGQTGCQLAEELHEEGRQVVLSCGRAPWAPRRPGGRDVILWLIDAGFYDQPVADLRSPAARLVANVQATGRNGGHDLSVRTLREAGVTLAGRFLGAENGRFHFAPDLADSVAFGDDRYAELCNLILDHCAKVDLDPPELLAPPPFDPTAPDNLDIDDFGVIVHTSGFRPDYGTWIHMDAFDGMGFPVQEEGASVAIPGLYFCGVHFLRKRKSSLLMGVGEDAAIVAEAISKRHRRRRRSHAGSQRESGV